MYDFDKVVDRRGTSSIKWNVQYDFGQKDGLLPFWIADTDFAVEPKIVEALKKRCDHPTFGYADPWDNVYDSIQGWWDRRHGWKPDTSWMFISGGVVTSLYFNLQMLIPQGEKVLVFTPVYDPFFAAVQNSGHELVACPLNHEDNIFTINYEKFEEELKNGVKGVIICNPHNPIARVWTEEELQKIASLCKKYDVYVFSDEVHCDYALTRPYTPMGKFKEIHDKLIVYTAVSKSFNLAGMVSSCLMIPNPKLKKQVVADFESRWMFGPCDLAFTAMEAAYTYADTWMDEAKAYVEGNAKIVSDFISEKMPKVHVTKHEGTFLMWLDMRCYGMSSAKITEVLAKEYGIALGDGSHYGEQADGFMRFNIGCARETLNQGLEQLSKMYDKYMN
ncbi:MAG: MalY/PatB family protein [Lachnospiraceae bacterium]